MAVISAATAFFFTAMLAGILQNGWPKGVRDWAELPLWLAKPPNPWFVINAGMSALGAVSALISFFGSRAATPEQVEHVRRGVEHLSAQVWQEGQAVEGRDDKKEQRDQARHEAQLAAIAKDKHQQVIEDLRAGRIPADVREILAATLGDGEFFLDDLSPRSLPTIRRTVQISWMKSTYEERTRLSAFLAVQGIDTTAGDEHLNLRRAKLSFYPNLTLFELSDSETNDQAYIIVDFSYDNQGEWYQLNFTKSPIYAAGSKHLLLTRHNVCSYAAFFFSASAGPYGLMPVIESLQPSGELLDGDIEGSLEELAGVIPPRFVSERDNVFLVDAALLFQGAVFRTRIEISRNGNVKVIDYELVLASDEEEEAEQIVPSEPYEWADLRNSYIKMHLMATTALTSGLLVTGE